MHFNTIIAAAIAATSALAVPVDPRPALPFHFGPSASWQYSVNNGAISGGSSFQVSKSHRNGGRDKSVLLTFKYPPGLSRKQCQLEFYLPPGARPTGSKKVDVFSSNVGAKGPTKGWGPGNQRNQHLGRLIVVPDNTAIVDFSQSAFLRMPIPCKRAGTIESFEVVGVSDNVLVDWKLPPSTSGQWQGLRIGHN